MTHQEGGVSNDIGDNNKKDNSTEVTNIRRDDSIQQPKHKDSIMTKSSQPLDFLEDSLIKECDPSHRCIIENKKFIACLKVSGEGNFPAVLVFLYYLSVGTIHIFYTKFVSASSFYSSKLQFVTGYNCVVGIRLLPFSLHINLTFKTCHFCFESYY